MKLRNGNDVFWTLVAFVALVAVPIMAVLAIWVDWRWGATAFLSYIVSLVAGEVRKP